MNIIALDVGVRRTGVAFLDTLTGVPIALDTIHHKNFEELLNILIPIINSRKVGLVVLGLPLLPSGKKGSQCKLVDDFSMLLANKSIPFTTIDERYTSFAQKDVDCDASAAVQILETAISLGIVHD